MLIPIGFFGGGSQSHWVAVYGEPNSVNNSIAVDSSGSVYVTGTAPVGGGWLKANVAKFNADGAIQWQKLYGQTNSYQSYGGSLAIDASNNVYLQMSVQTSGQTWNILKLNQSGVVQSQYRVNSTFFGGSNTLSLDSSGSIAMGAGDSGTLLWNTSGSLSTARVTNYDAGIYKTHIATDGSKFICGGIGYFDSFDNYQVGGALTKLASNISSTIWHRQSNVADSPVSCVTTDSAGNVYFARTQNGVWSTYKMDSTGTIIWQRQSTGVTGPNYPSNIKVDSLGNVYVVGKTAVGSGEFNPTLIKFDSSGNQLFARYLSVYTGSNSNESANDIKIDADGNMYIVGQFTRLIAGTQQGISFIAKLPVDGSKTGTYSVGGYSVTYAALAFTSNSNGAGFGSAAMSNSANTGTSTTATGYATDNSTTSSSTIII